MFRLKIHFLLTIFLGLFFACETEVELDFEDEEQSLAIYSLFSPNDLNFKVEVSATQSILVDSEFQFIDDARVTISSAELGTPEQRSSEEVLESISSTENNISYETSNTIPQDGFTYELQVEHKDFEPIVATSFVPAITKINNIELSEFKESKENELPGSTRYRSNATFEVSNNTASDNHFHLLVYLNTPFGWRPINIEQDALQEQLGGDATIIDVENSLVFFGAHFDDKEFSGSDQQLNFDFSFSLTDQQNASDIIIELRSVSKDYQNYFVEGYRIAQAGSNAFFVSSDNISNNIENGYGVFAGYSNDRVFVPFRK